MNDDRIALFELDHEGLQALMVDLEQPRYRADQLWRWLYVHLADDFAQMSDLPSALRDRLSERCRLNRLRILAQTQSEDGLATKFLFGMPDGQQVETVLMHYVDPADDDAGDPTEGSVPAGRHTICLSTQAGCAMGCVFCATGQMGLLRDLSVGECIEQVLHCARLLRAAGQRLSNVVFMGMGEPLANWDATWACVQRLTDAKGLGLSPRRLTISTVGIVPGIRRLAESGVPLRLAVSLHAPDDALRSQLVAINQVYGLSEILAACRDYQAVGGRRISFEYVLIAGINDAPEQARHLAARLGGLDAHVNLIPLNPTEGSPMRPSSYRAALAFQDALRQAGIGTTLRMRRGIDVQAGCGQLRSRAESGRLGRSIPLIEEMGASS